jgi:hypothetical protein
MMAEGSGAAAAQYIHGLMHVERQPVGGRVGRKDGLQNRLQRDRHDSSGVSLYYL